MSKGRSWFSDQEKEAIEQQLLAECEQSWKTLGYKNTSISQLASRAGISTGAFYSFFKSKEDIFFSTLLHVRSRLRKQIVAILQSGNAGESIRQAMLFLYDEYAARPFLYDVNSDDAKLFMSKIPREIWQEYKQDNALFVGSLLTDNHIATKVEPQLVHSIMAALVYIVTAKEQVPLNREAFEFLLYAAIDKILE